MKSLAITIGALLFTFGIQAQNKNVTEVSKVTTRTVKTSEGEKKLIKKEDVSATQKIDFEDADSKKLNKEVKSTPIEVTATTQIIDEDGNVRTIDVDRSAIYNFGGNTYQLSLDNTGYTVINNSSREPAMLRKTSNGNYIYSTKDRISFGYFDKAGNLILETYDAKNDKIIYERYDLIK